MTPKELLNHVLPSDVPDLLGQLNWTLPPSDPPEAEPEIGTTARIAVVGQSGVGKKTLCNTLWGWNAVTANGEAVRRFGRLTLIDLPTEAGGAPELTAHLSDAQMIIYVLDAARPASESDFLWLSRLRALNLPVLAAANKVDLVEGAALKQSLAVLRQRLAVPVIPVSAINLYQVHHQFLPAVLKAFPETAEALAGEIAGLRRRVAGQMTVRAAVSSVFFSLRAERDPDQQDVALLVSLQMRLMRRIGMLYGYRPRGGHGRELVLMLALRFLFRRALWLAGRYPLARAWMLNGTLALVTTMLVGRFAVIYYSASLPGWLRWL
ncbi:MAG: hypothetical protein IPO91_29220 [Chloroflexi bacterium]|nr:hypothetical protein [Chloroflexota bacterium]